MKNRIRLSAICIFLCAGIVSAKAQNNQLGIFDDHSDVGQVRHKGNATYDDKRQQYQLEGAGSNVWATHDEFHYAWKKMKGDFILRTNISFIGKGVEEHRKVGWMVRSSLDTNSKHISAVVHGSGLTSLQYRPAVAVATLEKKF